MAQPYIGEIRMFAGNFAPAGWAFCEGQLIPISENDTLFNLIGTTYGGDGQENFALPDLRGRIPLHQSNNFPLAEEAGVETVTLTINQMPGHTHPLVASQAVGADPSPVGNVFAQGGSGNAYRQGPAGAALAPQVGGPIGGSQPHDNFMPYLCVDFIISLFGIYPSPT
jgi:microcystin-dependent protein